MTEPDPAVEYGLVMPFVNVTSKGGQYDDEAYCAGWEMGHLDADLDRKQQPQAVFLTIRAGNTQQADLLAMKYGYRAEATDSEVDGWSYLKLTKATE